MTASRTVRRVTRCRVICYDSITPYDVDAPATRIAESGGHLVCTAWCDTPAEAEEQWERLYGADRGKAPEPCMPRVCPLCGMKPLLFSVVRPGERGYEYSCFGTVSKPHDRLTGGIGRTVDEAAASWNLTEGCE